MSNSNIILLIYQIYKEQLKILTDYSGITWDSKIPIIENYDLEDSVNDFLIYYNNRKHRTTGIAPYLFMRNDDEHFNSNVKLKTEKKERS